MVAGLPMVVGIGAPLEVVLAVALAVVVDNMPAVEVQPLLGFDKRDTPHIVQQFADRNPCTV